MNRLFRKYHRVLALILSLPLTLTIITGMVYTISTEWLGRRGQVAQIVMAIHTGEIVHLEPIYPVLCGLGTLGLLVTGLSLAGVFGRKPHRSTGDA